MKTSLLLNERGLTVAEILVAMVIIGIGLVGLATVIPLSTYGVSEGKGVSTATFLAEQKLEEVRNATWATAAATDCVGLGAPPTTTTCTRAVPTSCTSGTSCATYSNESAVTGYPGYSRTVNVTDCGAGAGCAGVVNSAIRLVTVTVTYTPISATGSNAVSGARSTTLQMVIAQRQ
jgi:Tfp pilus assembly protein PilV